MGTAMRSSRGLLLWPFVATTTSPDAAPSGTRATMNCSELMMMEPSTSPKRTVGRRSSAGRRPLPVMRISPPGKAQAGSMPSMCGLPLTFFAPAFRSIIAILVKTRRAVPLANNPKVQQQLQRNQRVQTCAKIVHYDTGAFRQPLEAAHRRRLHNVEYPEEYKAREQRLPHEGTRDERHQLPRNFVNHHMRWIFLAAATCFQCRNRNSERDHDND